MVEVHEQDADIIYVLEGSATLVTGGEIIGGNLIAPGEIRGTEVKGGETRTITKGDVIIVPAGTPHWFKEVPGPLNYYVVKAR
ncbi:MAG TPA: cupin domain-containing protein [Blastocatellia bacterium]|nr:cupin domain-containing protein [Blastocatellia bacterium]